jgi:hypothetical protein
MYRTEMGDEMEDEMDEITFQVEGTQVARVVAHSGSGLCGENDKGQRSGLKGVIA